MGNHDRQAYSFYRQSGFQIVKPFMLRLPSEYGNWVVSFSHYPWNEEFEDSGPIPNNHIRVHGHIHNNGYFRDAYVPFLRNHINVSVEQTKYRPVNLANLLSGYLLGTAAVTADDVQGGIEESD
jgi:calcineurin-like phosphoesterase family protein